VLNLYQSAPKKDDSRSRCTDLERAIEIHGDALLSFITGYVAWKYVKQVLLFLSKRANTRHQNDPSLGILSSGRRAARRACNVEWVKLERSQPLAL